MNVKCQQSWGVDSDASDFKIDRLFSTWRIMLVNAFVKNLLVSLKEMVLRGVVYHLLI